VITFVTTSGSGNNPAAALAFIGPTVNVTLAVNQRAHMVVHKAVGSINAAGANDLDVWACYQNTGGGAITQVGNGILDLRVSQNNRTLVGINHIYSGMAAATYTVGLCGFTAQVANWNSNEWGYISALVF